MYIYIHCSYRVKTLRILYIILQFIAISSLSCYISVRFIDPRFHILRSIVSCKWLLFYPIFALGLFWSVYLIIILFRLQSSFKGSLLALSMKTRYITGFSILLIPVAAFGALILDLDVAACMGTWIAPDLSHGLIYCRLPTEKMTIYEYNVIDACVFWICGLNIFLAVLFTVKLLKILKIARKSTEGAGEENPELKLMHLVVRNAGLTLIGALSTIIGIQFDLILFLCLQLLRRLRNSV